MSEAVKRPLDPVSRRLLSAIQALPRGFRPALNTWARFDSRLQDYPVPLRFWPERNLRLDLRSADTPQFLIHGCYPYQVAEDQLSARVLRPGDVVYDVGANLGYMTLMFLKSVGPSGRIHAFEPSPRSFAYLRRNVTESDPVELIQKAVGAEAGSVTFEEYDTLNLSSVAGFGTPQSGARKPVRTYSVETVTLDGYRARTGAVPRFVKIDVEGYEAQVFEGMRRLLADTAPILLFEAASPVELERNLRAIRAGNPDAYRFARIAHDTTLVPLDHRSGVTNNYFGMPGWADARFEGIAIPS